VVSLFYAAPGRAPGKRLVYHPRPDRGMTFFLDLIICMERILR
jgi:hypothetical protein